MHVDGSHRGITTFDLATVLGDDECEALIAVRSLDLSHNQLREIHGLGALTNVTALDMSFNAIGLATQLPTNVVKVVLSNNRLVDWRAFEGLPHLVDLDVSNNRLRSFVGCPPGLVSLRAAANDISVWSGLEHCVSLEHLDVSNTRIDSVEGLAALSTLRSLRIDLTLLPSGQLQPALRRSCPHLIELNGGRVEEWPSGETRGEAMQRVETKSSSSIKSKGSSYQSALHTRQEQHTETAMSHEVRSLKLALHAERVDAQQQRNRAAALSQQNQENARIISEQLAELARLRSALSDSEAHRAHVSEKLARASRDLKYARDQRGHSLQRRRVQDEQSLIEADQRLIDVSRDRDTALGRQRALESEVRRLRHDNTKLRHRVADLESRGDGDPSATAGLVNSRAHATISDEDEVPEGPAAHNDAAQALAEQMRVWVESEVSRAGA